MRTSPLIIVGTTRQSVSFVGDKVVRDYIVFLLFDLGKDTVVAATRPSTVKPKTCNGISSSG